MVDEDFTKLEVCQIRSSLINKMIGVGDGAVDDGEVIVGAAEHLLECVRSYTVVVPNTGELKCGKFWELVGSTLQRAGLF